MNLYLNQGNHSILYYNCVNNNRSRKTCPTNHYIRLDFLQEVILGEIRRLTKFASRYEKQFAEHLMGKSQHMSWNRASWQKKIKELSAELENATGKTVTAEMFIATVRKYTRAKKLSPRMPSERIQRIEVYHAEKIDGVYVLAVNDSLSLRR